MVRMCDGYISFLASEEQALRILAGECQGNALVNSGKLGSNFDREANNLDTMAQLSILCMLAMQLIFWLVPNLVVDIVAVSIFGFFFGPLFAAGISVASRL
ncbi:hypothetical protein AYO20_00426 [Fonsecaea nubica]|uniref:Uncharacterized protein n=1 Tax=Fonsecaea nubica TaxID=856822 RepID=A0A178DER1_9EURO|nr:hypothetical protein AYO20_00426 [Fonsecaea nubica]OAL40690.1 hypothetical protein AYO20_00426 [Fonsecaea nubica]